MWTLSRGFWRTKDLTAETDHKVMHGTRVCSSSVGNIMRDYAFSNGQHALLDLGYVSRLKHDHIDK